MGGKVPDSRQNDFQRLAFFVWISSIGSHLPQLGHGGLHQDGHHVGFAKDHLALLVRFPGQVSEEMRCGFAQVLFCCVQLLDHGRHESGKVAEEALDVGIAEGEIGQGHDGKPADIIAGTNVLVDTMQVTLKLQKKNILIPQFIFEINF